MIAVEKGGVYRAVRARSGVGEKGPWALLAVADERNEKRTTTIFQENVEAEMREGQQFKVVEIVKVKIGWKKDNSGAWRPDTTLSCIIEPIAYEGALADEGPTPWDDPDWGELPL